MRKIDELKQELESMKNEAQSLISDKKVEEAKAKMEEIKNQKALIEAQELLDKEEMNMLEIKDQKKKKENPVSSNSIKNFAAAARTGFKNSMNEGTSEDGGYTVPEDIQTNIEKFREAKESLINLVTVVPVNREKGQRTFKKRAEQTGFTKVGEGGKIPGKNTPKFSRISYEISKYAGYFPITNELLEDTDQNLVSVITEWIGDESRVTRNKLIISAIKTKAETTFSNMDDVKKAINVTLGSKFKNTSIIVTNDDGFQYLDTLKNSDGDYLIQKNVPEGTPHRLFGLKLKVVPNEDLPSDTSVNAKRKIPIIIGDLKEGIIFFDRKKMSIRASDIASVTGLNAFEEDLTLYRAIEREDIKVRDDMAFVNGTITIDDSSVVVAAAYVAPVSDTENTVQYTETELNSMTVEQIKALAVERGYTITKTVKAEIIAEFMQQQG